MTSLPPNQQAKLPQYPTITATGIEIPENIPVRFVPES
jgi:hypothetical protein